MSSEAVISLILAGLSLMVAAVTAIKQHALQRRMASIEEARRTEELSRARQADVTAYFDRQPNSSGTLRTLLVIHNRGPAAAQQVALNLKSVPGQGGAQLLNPPTKPLQFLDAAQAYSIAALTSTGSVLLELTWIDGLGSQKKTLHLST